MTSDDDERVTITTDISKAAYERASTMLAEKDPRLSVLGEFAGTMDIKEFFARVIEIYLED